MLCCNCRAQRDSSRWNDAEIYTAIARTLNLTSEQRKTILAARQYLQDKLAKYATLLPIVPCNPRSTWTRSVQRVVASALMLPRRLRWHCALTGLYSCSDCQPGETCIHQVVHETQRTPLLHTAGFGRLSLDDRRALCRVYAGRQVVNARFVALLQPDAVEMPGYSNRLRDVRSFAVCSCIDL